MKTELNPSDKHLMRLVLKDRNADGWAKVSKMVWPLLAGLPASLVEVRQTEDGGMAKLTHDGEVVLEWS